MGFHGHEQSEHQSVTAVCSEARLDYLRDSGDIKNVILRVGNALDKNGLGFLINRGSECFGCGLRDPLNPNAEVFKGYCARSLRIDRSNRTVVAKYL